MRLAVLTTETPHHTYFVQELQKTFGVSIVLEETCINSPTFNTWHPFEDERTSYEQQEFFEGADRRLRDVAETLRVGTVNDAAAVSCLKSMAPDVIMVFGTGLIKPPVIRIAEQGIINLHGGNPEEYRGLDSHLWAIYHNDFSGLVNTLHRINPVLDDGELILQLPIPIPEGTQLMQLRSLNTHVCLQLTLAALAMYERNGSFESHPQRTRGRYYSFMPSPLKDICVNRFERFTGARK